MSQKFPHDSVIATSALLLVSYLTAPLPSPAKPAASSEKHNEFCPQSLYIDRSGKVVAKVPLKVEAFDFHEGLARVYRDTFSFIDKKGKRAIPAQFKKAHEFCDGLAGVGEPGKSGFIRKDGIFAISPRFEAVLPFREGLAPVRVNDKCGFIDKSGKLIIDALYDNVACFSEGLAAAEIEGKIGFIDTQGKWRVEPQYDRVQGFSNGFALVTSYSTNPKGRFIDRQGKVLKEFPDEPANNPPFEAAFESYTGMPARGAARFGQSMLGDDASFRDGLAPFPQNKKYGFIDQSGKFVIQPQFDHAYPFANGKALIWMNGKFGYIDKSGKIIVAPRFEQATSFSEGLAAVSVTRDEWGYIDETGEFVIRPKYWKAYPFSEGLALVLKE